eukprot:4995212-Prymnesium_polylepis.1
MAPLYHIDLMTRSGQGASKQLTTLLKSTSNLFWKHGAVVADMRSWGTCELAYRCGCARAGCGAQLASRARSCYDRRVHPLRAGSARLG